jgi:hypothetical protein
MRSIALYRRAAAFAIACTALVLSTVGGEAAAGSAIQGSFSIYPLSTATTPVQLMAGISGDVWFVTASSRLGDISSTGAITLTATTVPSGTVPATLVAAYADGVWAYGDTSDGKQCTVSLVSPGGHVMQRTLGHPMGVCHGGAVDRAESLGVGRWPRGLVRDMSLSDRGDLPLRDTDGACSRHRGGTAHSRGPGQ